MADNVTFQKQKLATPPVDTIIGADVITDVAYQRMKVIIGDDGTNDGDVSAANPMPIIISAGGVTVPISNTISKDMEGGGIVAIGTTAVEMTFTGTPTAIILSAPLANTGTLYVGKSTVTSAGANAITYLEAGESLTIEYDDITNAVYVVATVAAQNVFKGALL